jgi:hypothetical protein
MVCLLLLIGLGGIFGFVPIKTKNMLVRVKHLSARQPLRQL